VTVTKILDVMFGTGVYDINNFIDRSHSRAGQDVRYSLDDSKLRKLGWSPIMNFDEQLPEVVNYYKERFVW